jgi:D-beta-D-heptose 7-phosphate kinase/D-beta-D-heptose 1-phosphate adenosyltransferase
MNREATFRGCPILVIGDVMLDEEVRGVSRRLSPEAPVPVVEASDVRSVPGGAANVAANVAALGGVPILLGVVGDDGAGDRLRARSGSRADLVADTSRPTTVKTRVFAGGKHVVRVDAESTAPVSAEVEARLLAVATVALARVRACVISDYGKGVVTPSLAPAVIRRATWAGVPVVVDPKGTDYAKYRGATLVKPNLAEASRAVGRDLRTDADVCRAAAELRGVLGSGSSVLITRGANGMTLFEAGRDPFHVPTLAREVFDVTGAGDTVAAAIATAIGEGLRLREACELATAASAVVVGRVGTATCGTGCQPHLSANAAAARVAV